MEMPLYQGTKRMKARPMTKAEYNGYRNWHTPEGEDPNEQGYFVEYVDGGKANDERHEGYISWSPADVFERAYRPCGSHVERMSIELDELDARSSKLADFVNANTVFATLPEDDQSLMLQQLSAMLVYQSILNQRLERATTRGEG